jgi:hypothetical protein
MSARSRMTQRALVQRSTSPGEDDYGNPLPGSWATHIAALPCWWYGSTEREAVDEETTAVVTDIKVMVPLSADVTEQDRIAGIVDRLGTTVLPGILGIETVLRLRSHKQLTLSQVQS